MHLTNQYWCSETTGVPGGLTLEQMNTRSSFSGFDFSTVWAIEEGKSTPYLQGMKIPDEAYDIFEEYGLFEGSGTSASPYLIHNVKELKRLKYDNEKRYYYKLVNDIDLASVTSWEPIGTEEYPFTGNFDGNGYTIKNMKIAGNATTASGVNVGLFGYTYKANISNLVLENYSITGGYEDSVGGLVGACAGGSISKVYAKGNISLSNTVEAWNVGGLVGHIWYDGTTTITGCYTEGNINVPKGGTAGGLVGWTQGGDRRVSVENSYTSAQVTANDGAGGLIGAATLTNINYCYAVGKVQTVGEVVGGLVGDIDTSSATSSYWSAELTGQLKSALGINTATSNLTKQEVYSGWNFSTIWSIEEGQSFAYLQGMLIPDMVYDKVKEHGTMDGTGTAAKPYIITTAEELNKIRYDLKGNYKLGANIDLSSITKWTPIGTETDPFTGTFDGVGYTISNMKIQGSSTENLGTDIGLFGWIDRATIKNVALENYNITGGSGIRVGGLVGYGLAPTITNVYTNGTINLAYNRRDSTQVGGIIGHVDSSDGASAQISQCYAGGTITTQVGCDVGGLVGLAQGTARRVYIQNSYSTASVNGNSCSSVGGLVGAVTATTIENSYTVGKVQGKGTGVGGLVGYVDDGRANNSYWCEELTGQAESEIGIKITASKLTQQGGYTSWNFSTIWAIENGTSFAYLQGMKVPDAVTQIVKDNTVMTGLGTAASPYIITDVKHFSMIKYDMTGYYKLGNDIDLASVARWTPIGTEEVPFAGNFDGAGHTIKNLKIDVGTSSNIGDNVGLFGYINRATISNVVIDNYKLNGGYGNNIGALVGYGSESTISKVYTNGSIYLGTSRYESSNIGGIIGTLDSSDTITSSISQCYSEGTITTTSTGYTVGGIAGLTQGAYRHSVTVQNCYSSATISAGDGIGGLVGHAATSYINYSYAMGQLTARGEIIGGLVGSIDSASATSSYWSEELTGRANSDIGMKITASNLTKQSAYSGWNFSTIWAIEEGKSYAYLQGMKVPDAVTSKVNSDTVMAGLGTSASPYIVTNAAQLNTVRYDLNAYYKLGNDIDLTSIARWIPIGTEEAPFTGSFNGDGHIIKNLKIDVGSSYNMGDNVGLFGYTNGGTIQNVTLDNYKLNGGYGNNIGALIGSARGTAVTKVHTKGSIYLGRTSVESWSTGGIVGGIDTSVGMTITQCYTEGTITANGANYVGGIVGGASGTQSITITNSYSTAQVSGGDCVGGVLGYADKGYVQYCYSVGRISSAGTVGGLVGALGSGNGYYSYWDTTTSGQAEGDIGAGRDTATMKTVSTYSGWSTTIWNLQAGSYPTLK